MNKFNSCVNCIYFLSSCKKFKKGMNEYLYVCSKHKSKYKTKKRTNREILLSIESMLHREKYRKEAKEIFEKSRRTWDD